MLVGADGRARLGDFGSAAAVADEREMRAFCGTPDYMSPEMVLSERAPWRDHGAFAQYAAWAPASHGTATDVWSLGATAYELLATKPPFENVDVAQDGSWVQLAMTILQAPVQLPQQVR